MLTLTGSADDIDIYSMQKSNPSACCKRLNGNIKRIVYLFVSLYLLSLFDHHSERLAVPQFGALFFSETILTTK